MLDGNMDLLQQNQQEHSEMQVMWACDGQRNSQTDWYVELIRGNLKQWEYAGEIGKNNEKFWRTLEKHFFQSVFWQISGGEVG